MLALFGPKHVFAELYRGEASELRKRREFKRINSVSK